jgi:serine/threonine protein phosphatase PrpC
MLDVQFGEASHPGKIRARKDNATGSYIPASHLEARSHGYLFAVADGIGGMEFGEIAAGTAISVLVAEFARAQNSSMLISLLPRLLQQANAAVHDRMPVREYRGRQMATTVVACALRYDQAVVSRVGDSRCYLIRGGGVRQLTQNRSGDDHQRRVELISATAMQQTETGNAPAGALGAEESITPETTAVSLQPGDVLVLCTDGVAAGMPETEMAAIAGQRKSAGEAARELVARALELNGSNNMTAQVVRVRAVEQAVMYRGRNHRIAG